MGLICLSDTHGLHNKIPKEWLIEADTIVHAGDCTNRGYLQELKQFLDWFSSLNYKNKILISGNHDFCFQTHPVEVEILLKEYPSVTYLQDSGCTIDGINFWGSPWQPEFYQWAFNLQRGNEIQQKWDLIPKTTDVLITHGPPYGIGDFVPYRGGEYVGCKDLLDTITTKLSIKAHICGHIHYSYGVVHKNNINFINAATCNEAYEVINKPILIEV